MLKLFLVIGFCDW